MAAHTHWRVKFTRSSKENGLGYIWLDELAFQDQSEADLSIGGSAISSGDFNASYPASAAFDKTNANAGWSSSIFTSVGQEKWLGYVHATPVDVKSVKIQTADNGNVNDLPVNWYLWLEYSDDGVTWFKEQDGLFIKTGTWGVGVQVVLQPLTLSYKSLQLPVSRIFPALQFAQGVFQIRALDSNPKRLDGVDGGSESISGLVTVENIPQQRRVRLYRRRDGGFIRETWSSPTGQYSFENIKAQEYFAVAHDHLRVYNAVIQDMLTP